ncbi:hypothetical protein P9272_18875 [Mesorhizobium sp. WSM4976]|uniref:hypothetical protein n=1 Tax=Mesorhizobium sp. WSM4976 TaxID=3038549 RepID=UPI0024160938|nr:hypothetical protein [Mesorhizobium sp. WSM4976]MDG4895635.1 hypothetical protein [Mesorhizobium sp. WSM4976]
MASGGLARPETLRIGQILRESFAAICRNLLLCSLLMLIFSVFPTAVFSLWSWGLAEHGVPAASNQARTLEVVRAVARIGLAGMLQIAVAFMVMEDSRGRQPTLQDCMVTAGRRALSAALVWLIANAVLNFSAATYWHAIGEYVRFPKHTPSSLADGIMMAGAAIVSIPGIILWARWFVAIPVLEREKPSILKPSILKSLRRSRDLTKGSRWSLAVLWLIMFGMSSLMIEISRYWVRPFGVASLVWFDVLTTAADSLLTAVIMAASYSEILRVKEGGALEDVSQIFS